MERRVVVQRRGVWALIIAGSLVWAARAQDPPEFRPVRTLEIGKVFEMRSRILKEMRSFTISLPASYDRSVGDYPLVVVLDGEYYTPLAAQTARFLAQYRLMPEAVVVGVHNVDRRLDLTPPDISLPDVPRGRADSLLAFIGDELLPMLESYYRLLPLRILVGHSHAGLVNLYALSARPDLFRWHVAMDTPVHLTGDRSDQRLRSFFADHPAHVGRLMSIERTFGWGERMWDRFATAAPPRFSVKRMALPDESHETMVYRGLYEGFRWLFRDLTLPGDSLTTVTELKRAYAKLSDAYGYDVQVPRATLVEKAEDLLFAGKTDMASDMLAELRKTYPGSDELSDLQTWVDQLRREPVQEPYDVLLNMPPPSQEQIRPYVGVWDGVIGENSPYRIILTISIRDGEASATIREFSPSGRDEVGTMKEVPYLRVFEDGSLEWGTMNGMRPRTLVIVGTGRIDRQGKLSGTQSPKGVSWPPSLGKIPKRHVPFSLERRS